MTDGGTPDKPLEWDVFVTPSIPLVSNSLPPGQKQMVWQPMASTLIFGRRDAILVDAYITVKQTEALIEWVAKSGKNLTTIYVTHGHGDHWFGIGVLLSRFPNARAVATASVVEVMRRRSSPETLQGWKAMFPGQIPDKLIIADKLQGNSIQLEGQDLVAVEVGHSDTEFSTCLHVPSIGLVVAGDVAYSECHQYFAETDKPKRQEWIAALDKIKALNPTAVIAGHKRPGRADSPQIVEETQKYIRDFDCVDEMTTTKEQLYDEMLQLYPDRVNPGMLWVSARAAKGEKPFG